MPEVKDVKEFWEENPLWTGESEYPPGSREFFEEHDFICIDDCLGGQFDERILPPAKNRVRVLEKRKHSTNRLLIRSFLLHSYSTEELPAWNEDDYFKEGVYVGFVTRAPHWIIKTSIYCEIF